jgi:hypothetical protein
LSRVVIDADDIAIRDGVPQIDAGDAIDPDAAMIEQPADTAPRE